MSSTTLHHRKLAWRLDDGTELRLPPQFLSAVATGMTSIAAENAASAAVIGSTP